MPFFTKEELVNFTRTIDTSLFEFDLDKGTVLRKYGIYDIHIDLFSNQYDDVPDLPEDEYYIVLIFFNLYCNIAF